MLQAGSSSGGLASPLPRLPRPQKAQLNRSSSSSSSSTVIVQALVPTLYRNPAEGADTTILFVLSISTYLSFEQVKDGCAISSWL